MCTNGGLAVGDCVSLDVDAHAGVVHHFWREGALDPIGSIVPVDGQQEVLPMRIPVTTRRIALIATVAVVIAAAGCDSSDDVVTIPSSDGSSPSVAMDAHFNVEQRPYMTVTNGSTPQKANAKADETVTLIATGSDPDGGVKTIEIYMVEDDCGIPDPDDDMGVACFHDFANVVARNPDPDVMKTAGATAAKSRTVSYNVNFPHDSTRSFEADAWARVTNWAGDEVDSAHITIEGRT
jgi:hypothetical protein